ncbi:hypothetical protein [Kitasatospora sp. NPDC057015]|uniref:hypothetical protein n=1 Tax=Kitasatospora sp. NPDC057015 TaxID=3346001 RepID=UPI0036321DC2
MTMRTFTPDAGTPADGPSPAWGIRRAVRLAFPEPAALAGDPVHTERLRRYLTDLLRPYGRDPGRGEPAPEAGVPAVGALETGAPETGAPDVGTLDVGALGRGGQSYGEMAEALIRATLPAGESVDLLVLAHSIPDITPGRATSTYLSHVCPGTPMAFAVSDQGAASAFTALRLVDAYARSGGLRRALLLVVEQCSLPYDPGVPVSVPAESRGVALLFGEPLPGEQVAGVSGVATHALAADSPAAALAAELGRLGDAPASPTVIIGATAAAGSAHAWPVPPGLADAGQPGTGVWWELAGELAGPPAGPRRLLLADYDAGPRHLSLATIGLPGEGGVPG